MKKLLAGLFALGLVVPASAQWQVPTNTIPIGKGTGVIGFDNIAPGAAGRIIVSSGTAPVFVAPSQDCTISAAGVFTCLRTNNVLFTTAATTAIGTSGATIPLLNGNNTYSGTATFSTTATFNGAATFSAAVTLGASAVATTPTPGDNDTSVATTAFVATSFAPLASPALTGNPTAPTAATNDNDTSIASTAFVQGEIAGRAAAKNWLINSSFVCAQYHTAGGTDGTTHPVQNPAYIFDRWGITRFGVADFTATRENGATNSGVPFGVKLQRTNATSSTVQVSFWQTLSAAASRSLAGRTVTFSFIIESGANWSGTGAGGITSRVLTGTGIEQPSSQAVLATWSGWAQQVKQYTVAAGASRTLLSQTVTVSSSATEVAFSLEVFPSGTAGANDWVKVDSIQVNIGSFPTAFYAETFEEAWPKCAAYYQDFARLAINGARTLTVPTRVIANNAGGAAGTNQNWSGLLQFMPKRHNSYAVTLSVGNAASLTSHVTINAGGAIYDLIFDAQNHEQTDRCLINIHYVIVADGIHVAAANIQTWAELAVDGGAPELSFLRVNAEIPML